ncbi:ABC transporter ATP-binding protein [bacterium]|nr:ABC transporter ATP-binding protein [bacterium]
MLKLDKISVKLGDFELQKISFDVEDGEYFVLLGESGIGKTVLLESIAGLIEPDEGKIFLDSENISNKKIQKRNIGIVYQDDSLFPHMNVRENIIYPLKCNHNSKKEIRDKLNKIVDKFNINSLLYRKINTLSGGELQKVALARTLITNPKILLLDEPLSSLDVNFREKIKSILRKINRDGQTIVHITHDYQEAISLADRIGIMENGKISQIGTPDEIFRHPKSQFVANFIGIKNFYRGKIVIKNKSNEDISDFNIEDLTFHILSDAKSGVGFLILRSEDIIISNNPTKSSARNNFRGKVIDIAHAKLGVEITVDIGVEISALITKESLKLLDIDYGKDIWVSFKASAAKFIGG